MSVVGVLALQGDFEEHTAVFESLGAECKQIRLPEQMNDIDRLVIPGGESTTLSRLCSNYGFRDPIKTLASSGMPIWGTCAGMIMLADKITESDPIPLQIMDIEVQRNAFGRQIDSFEQIIPLQGIAEDFNCIFIRAPIVMETGPAVNIIAELDNGNPIAVQEGNLLATSFHPELSNDSRVHKYFLDL
ncbi:MAG: pyridoxal 5'-phosphate synthase glutaminase subunit PdxT [Chloroflexi bacterium]|nr:pyridoxal 5'-phosphate synthase glutaminase subunit PdxT [Chloroflexota bacterium]